MSEPDFPAEQINDLCRVVYGLYVLIKVHFAKHSELYLLLLDGQLSNGAAHQALHHMAKRRMESAVIPVSVSEASNNS